MGNDKKRKELEKFETEYKYCTRFRPNCTSDLAEKIKQRMVNADKLVLRGITEISRSVLDAQKKGVTGTKIEDYQRDKGVNDTVKGTKSILVDRATMAKEFLDMKKRAEKAMPLLEKLDQNISKDLKSRGKLSKSKPDIKKLQAKVQVDIKDLDGVIKKADSNIKAMHTNPEKQWKPAVTIIMNRSQRELKNVVEERTPRGLDIGIMGKNFNQMATPFRELYKQCDDSIKAARLNDEKGAVNTLAAAKKNRAKVKAIYEKYEQLERQHRDRLKGSKEGKAWYEKFEDMDKLNGSSAKKIKEAQDAVDRIG